MPSSANICEVETPDVRVCVELLDVCHELPEHYKYNAWQAAVSAAAALAK
jgi:hypothetical protein